MNARGGWGGAAAPSWRATLLIPAVFAASFALPKLWQGAFSVDTGWYAAIALGAFRDGSFITLPGVGGPADADPAQWPYFNKPPLAFWAHGAALWTLGATIFAARLPAALAGVACCVVLAGAVRRAHGAWAGLFAGVVLATTPEFIRHGRAFSLDLWMALWLVCALWCAVEAEQRRRDAWLALAGVFTGLALLTKPLLALAWPIALGVWLGARRRFGAVAMVGAAAVVAIVVAAPWHAAMVSIHGDAFTDQYFGREIADRAAAAAGDNFNEDAAQPWYYVEHLAKAGWPWLAIVPFALVAIARRQHPAGDARWLWLIVPLLVAALVALNLFPDKRPRYLVPVYPLAAWWIGVFLANCPPRNVRAVLQRVATRGWVVAAVGGVALSLAPVRVHGPDEPQWIALFEFMRQHDIEASDLHAAWYEGARGARVYLEFGAWPSALRDPRGNVVAQPPAGGLVVYHFRDGLAPGAGETELLREGYLTVTRLEADTWAPVDQASNSASAD